MIRFSVEAEIKKALKELDLTARQIPKLITRSLNKTAMQARTVARRNVAKRMGIKQSAIKGKILIDRASPTSLQSGVAGTGRPISLVNFAARQTKKGVTAKAWGVRKLYPGAFLATPKVGGKQVFVRKGLDSLPIKKLFGPGVPAEMADEETVKALDDKVREAFPKILRQEGAFLMRKNKK